MGHVDPAGGANPQAPPRVIPFGKYLLLDRIAVGGMAEVYTAKSFGIEGFEKIIAIKRILPTMAEDRDFITMFIDEAKIAGHLTHANIVPIYELGKIGESHYIAMEYVWGKDLLQIMNRFRRMRRHMPPVMAAWIASKMLEGLDYAHRKRDRHGRPMGIIHRDVSPQNCLVSYEGQIKLIDFGIAKAASRNTKTQAGVLKGKFGYMSPEQVRGNTIDHRSDIFAVSTCLHEMLTGERLFVGESDFSTLEKVRNADVVPPSTVLSEMPAELEEILMKGLAGDPDERWQTAGEMQEALQRFIALSRPPFGTSKLNTWMRTAFAPEIAKEKARLDTFSKIGHPGSPPAPQPRAPSLSSTSPQNPAARRGGAVPAPPAPKKQVASLDDFANMPDDFGDEDENEFGGEATMITSSPFEAMQEAADGTEEIAEQATQIFFAAEEMEEIHDEAPAPAMPAGSLSSPAPMPAAARMPPPRAIGNAAPAPQPIESATAPKPTLRLDMADLPPPMPPSPTPAPVQDMFAPPPPSAPQGRQRGVETIEMERPGQLRPAKQGGMGKWIAIMAVAAVAVLAVTIGGAVVLFGGDDTGTISVRVSPADAHARVFVDGVLSGNADLILEHVPAGTHEIEVRAEGYVSATQSVPVTGDGTALLAIELHQDLAAAAAPPAVAAAAPPAPPAPAPAPPSEPIALVAPPPAPAPEPAPAPAPAPVAHDPEPEAHAERAPARTPREEHHTPQRVPNEGDNRPQRVETPRRSAGGGGSGFLMIQTLPWARVFLDGRDTGRNTPVRQLRVSAGHHTIGLRTNDGTMHTVQVDVQAGQTQRIVRQL